MQVVFRALYFVSYRYRKLSKAHAHTCADCFFTKKCKKKVLSRDFVPNCNMSSIRSDQGLLAITAKCLIRFFKSYVVLCRWFVKDFVFGAGWPGDQGLLAITAKCLIRFFKSHVVLCRLFIKDFVFGLWCRTMYWSWCSRIAMGSVGHLLLTNSVSFAFNLYCKYFITKFISGTTGLEIPPAYAG